MGAVVERPLPAHGNSRIIDYATQHRSDFGDIYLLGKCRFLLCCGTGTESVPPLFGIPVAKANMMPLRPTPVGANGLYIPKLIRPLAGGRPLSFAECAEMGAYAYGDRAREMVWEYPGRLEQLGYTPDENEAEDILDLCLDMLDLLDGIPSDSEAARLQALYQSRFFGHFPDACLLPKIGARFALKYRNLIEA
jgi:putative glycosyltransferase (TIGR04372 family)